LTRLAGAPTLDRTERRVPARLATRGDPCPKPAAAEIVLDADGHLCEPPDLWTRNLPSHLRDQGPRLIWNEATGFDELWIEDRAATDRGLVGLGTPARPI